MELEGISQHDEERARIPYSAERRLMAYQFIDAIERWRLGKKEAARWLFLADNPEYLFSFESVCQHLGYCPNDIRKKLLNARKDITFMGFSISQFVKKL